ncbi:MAG: EpsG family protein [Treponema sp.]|nr:EpsG family protein [Treponema sp.]
MIFLLAGISLLFLAGFRYGFETDYFSYKSIFEKDGMNYEPLFVFLIRFCKSYIADSYNAFVFLIAFLSISLKISFFAKCRNSCLALFLYFCLFYIMAETNGIRQGFAISFLLLSLPCVRNRKLIRFSFFVLLATCCHTSSLIFLPVYFICNLRLSIKKIVAIICMTIVIRFIFFDMVVQTIEFLFLRFNQNTYIFSAVRGYLSNGTESILTVGLIRRIIYIVLFLLLNGRRNIQNVYFNTYLLGVCIYTLFMGNSVLSNRFSLSFEAALVPLFANLHFKLSWKNIYLLACVYILSLALLIMLLSKSNAVPYQSYLFLEG